jgi:hypothetical protein
LTFIKRFVDFIGRIFVNIGEFVFSSFSLFGVIFFSIVVIVYIFSGPIPNYFDSNTSLLKKVSKIERKIDKVELLSGWVYSNSSKISKETCKEIVTEVLKTRNPLLMLSIIEAESSFVQSSVSSKGAMGLVQINPVVHVNSLIKLGIIKEKRDLFNIKESILGGQYVLDDCLKSSGNNVPKALHMYLGGQDGRYFNQILSNLANLYIISEAGIVEDVKIQVVEPIEKSKMKGN